MKPFLPRFFLMGFLVLASAATTYAQCAMCAATVQSNAQTDKGSIGNSLNTGILYLMVLPYIMFGTIAFFWYKSAKKQKAEAQRKAALRARTKAAALAVSNG